MKLFEVHFTFTPNDPDSVGEGLITVEAETPEEAKDAFLFVMENTPDLNLIEIKEVVVLPDHADFSPRTLN